MTAIGFYHLQISPLEAVLPKLLERAFGAGHRILVKVPDEQTAERLAQVLWTYSADSFLPHGTPRDPFPAEQPIYLTAGPEIPNGADLVCRVEGGVVENIGQFARALDLFDGGNPDAVAAARGRWRAYLADGHILSYWQQKREGGWDRKA